MYIDLKLFRLEHNNMYQRELGEILGIEQSVLSRMEKQFAELNEVQYKRLCEKYGEDEVLKYKKESPLANTIRRGRGRKGNAYPVVEEAPTIDHQNATSDVSGLIAVVKSQQDEIAKLNQRIADLTQIILEKIGYE